MSKSDLWFSWPLCPLLLDLWENVQCSIFHSWKYNLWNSPSFPYGQPELKVGNFHHCYYVNQSSEKSAWTNLTLHLLWGKKEKTKQQQCWSESHTKVKEQEKWWGTFCPMTARLRKVQGMGQGIGSNTMASSRCQGTESFGFIRLNYNYSNTLKKISVLGHWRGQ